MKINFDIKKGADAASNLLAKTADFGKKAVEEAQKSAIALSDKAKNDSFIRRLKKYNPLFPDVYGSPDFHYPNIIIIVEDSVRKDIDVCEGAVGWLNNDIGVETLYLHESIASNSSIQFYPAVTCDSVFYVDNFDKNRYIRTDCIFGKAHEERLAELKHVAHALGATSCSIEISESSSQINIANGKGGLNAGKLFNAKAEAHSQQAENLQRTGKITAEFEGCNTPKKPKLKWFAQDENIKRLIDMRCKGINTIKSEVLELSGSSSATMTQKAAVAIDGTINKLGISGSYSMESQAVREIDSKLIFRVEF